MATQTFTKSGSKATTAASLPKEVFAVEVKNHEVLKAAYVAYLANGRVATAKAKTRGEVSGGGKKPWKQKGTGRARFGSSRNPIWRGGGVAFGPTGEENHSHKLTTSVKRLALRQALTLASTEGKIKVIESFDNKDSKVKATVELLNKIEATGNVLFVVAEKTPEVVRATKNIPTLKVVASKYINIFDAMNSDAIVIEKEALSAIQEWLGGSK